MLEFIVLGQIPGTPLQITFYWVLIAAVLAMGLSARHWQAHEEQPHKSKKHSKQV